MQKQHHPLLAFLCFISIIFGACQSESDTTEDEGTTIYYNGFPVPDDHKTGWERFDHLFRKDSNYVNEFELTHLIPDTYKHWKPSSTFPAASKMINREDLEVHFFPLDQDTAKQFQYVHKYNCIYNPKKFRYADVAYPNPCSGKDARAKARVVLINKSKRKKTMHCRLFYQNNSYWFPTSPNADFVNKLFLQNYYGQSDILSIDLEPGETKETFIEYIIGQDPKKDEWTAKKFYGPARPGAYEFMLWATENPKDLLVQEHLDLRVINPFGFVQEKKVNGDEAIMNSLAYTHATHFKFISLMEDFNGDNIYEPNQVYLLGHKDEKPLCDTCTGYFKDISTDLWNDKDYFKGKIHKAPWIKAEYGNRKENVRIDENGIYLKCPGVASGTKEKTWGEVKFGPSFLYGTVKAVVKFSQLRNDSMHTPTGIVHNLWLYQYNHPFANPIKDHPYAYLVNDKNKQPYEIDIEIWSKIYEENWAGGSAINYSIVDYMRDPNAVVKPGQAIDFEGKEIDRLNNIQLNYPGTKLLGRDFFEQYHLYEIVWNPYDIRYKIDGKEVAKIDWRMAKIPDEYAFLWIGSPIYQDGTFYAQNGIPFLTTDRFTHIRYLSIE